MAEYPTGLEGLVNWLGIQFQVTWMPMPEYPIVNWKHAIYSILWSLGCIVYYGRFLFLWYTRLKDFDLVDLVKIIRTKLTQNSHKIHTKFTQNSQKITGRGYRSFWGSTEGLVHHSYPLSYWFSHLCLGCVSSFSSEDGPFQNQIG